MRQCNNAFSNFNWLAWTFPRTSNWKCVNLKKICPVRRRKTSSFQEKISESIATLYAEHYNVLQHITDPALHQFRLKGKRKITYATSVLDYTRQYLSSLWPLTLHVQSIWIQTQASQQQIPSNIIEHDCRKTLQVCLHFSSVHIVPTGRPLHRRLIQLPADTPTHLLGTHPSTSADHESWINNTSNLEFVGHCSPAH